MLEGSSHHLFNLKDIKKNRNSIYNNLENFSPVLEKIEENVSENNEDQKVLSKQSGIKYEENTNNKTHLKDSVISNILSHLDNKEKKNRTIIVKRRSILKPFKRNTGKQPSAMTTPNINNLFNIIKKNPTPTKKTSFKLNKPKFLNITNKNQFNFNKKEDLVFAKYKRRTIAIPNQGLKRRSSQLLVPDYIEKFRNFNRPIDIKKKTYKENKNNNNNSFIQTIESTDTNQKLMNNFIRPSYKQSGTFDNSRMSDDFRFSFLLKKNKIHFLRNFSFKNSKIVNDKKVTTIQELMNERNIKKKEKLIKKVKKYSFIQSICSLISILLCIIDIELYNNYSYNYIIENNIEYDKLYEIRKREINSKENIVRTMNGIFSFLCLLMTFCIFISKYNFNKKQMKKILNNKNRNLSFIHQFKYKKDGQWKIDEKNQISKILLRAIINLIFYPPKLNVIIHTYSDNILCIYPLNSFFLLLSSFKLYNIYRCIFYFIPVTATLGKAICEKYNVKLDIKFMFKIFLSKHKLSFPFVIIIIFMLLNTVLMRSIEKFSVDLSLSQTTNSNITNYNNSLYNKFNIYDTLWVYLSFITRNTLGDIRPQTPFGKILLFILYIFGSLFLCMIYLRLNYLFQFDRTSFQAYSKLKKLFLPENKENKASEVIISFLLLKKYYSQYKIDKKDIENNQYIHNEINYGRRKTIYELKINQLKEENIIIFKQKKIFFLEVKFIFFLKFLTDINIYLDSYKISRKQPLNMSSLFQSIEGKMDDNLQSINGKLSGIESIDTIFENLKSNDHILLKKLQKLRKLDYSLINYLAEVHNFHCNNYFRKIKTLKTEILLSKSTLKRSKTKVIYNFKSTKSIKYDL